MIAQSDLAVIVNGNSDAIAKLIARRAQFGPPPVGMFKLSSVKTAAPGWWDQITGSASNAAKGLMDQYVTPHINQAGKQFANSTQNQFTQNLQNVWNEHPGLRYGVYGAGLGGLLGLGSGLMGRKKRPLSNLLTGALMGAGVGAGGAALYNAYNSLQNQQGQGAKTDQPPADQVQPVTQPSPDTVQTARDTVADAYDHPSDAASKTLAGAKNQAIQALAPDRGYKPLSSRILGNVAGVWGGKRIYDIARGAGQGFTNPTRWKPGYIPFPTPENPTSIPVPGRSVPPGEPWTPTLGQRLQGGLEGALKRPLSSVPLAGMGLADRYDPRLGTAHNWAERENARYLAQGAKETPQDLRAGAKRNLAYTPDYSEAVATEAGVEGLQRAWRKMPFPLKAINWGWRTGLPYGGAIATAFLDPFKRQQAQQASAAGVNSAFGLPPPGVPSAPTESVNPNVTMQNAVKPLGNP
jgi:hypothetical protein